ncbi:tRNA (adenosine(37)-N6)-threonylcarbamoyltransferase complex transferase subunit TsaD [Patescibacteria group bacterium]|nr:tRNA (adenosine(37)-N6)-threonylcarbamoyltransferase complex transferase subunit TsaD [Patescibacteria group bacterium]MBU1721836.1 tRNA (adenosine(37)-N6)-threonylcarbamoyltransferase complex transferase subunit TsaD [Patescibacteria group bacterium]MBU1901669.1 tRNA (adenosine(37)-N6)-threonylcarbamoyltransferase complex transferase subunit TsaD [Patescibacteria group bacterium]
MIILGIESSCDDTSIALLEVKDSQLHMLAEKTASQIDIHKIHGGVIPEIAGRAHAEHILPVIEEVLKDQPTPDAIAVTAGPGLVTALLVGVEAAKSLSYLLNIPLIRINHMEGHIYSPLLPEQGTDGELKDIAFPALCLTVSGGHSAITLMHKHGEYERIGATRDDAAGETFDKIAKMVGFEYPGGPKISKAAKTGNPKAIDFPRPMILKDTCDFSFAGLKTAALYWLRDNTFEETTITREDFCASIEAAIVDSLLIKTMRAAKKHQPKTIILAGGVSANPTLRTQLEERIAKILPHTTFLKPQKGYSMDNAAMIALAGYYHAKEKDFTTPKELFADPQWYLTDNSN